jgi:hypothetical protein
MYSNDKISDNSKLKPPNYDKVLKPIEKDSIFSNKISVNNNRERESNKQTTVIGKAVKENDIPIQLPLGNLELREAFMNEKTISPWCESATLAVNPTQFNPSKCSFSSWKDFQETEAKNKLIYKRNDPQICIENKLKFGIPLFSKP